MKGKLKTAFIVALGGLIIGGAVAFLLAGLVIGVLAGIGLALALGLGAYWRVKDAGAENDKIDQRP
ncbi:hypothetical protein [Hyphococcus sp.]|uniref:hypothetical protein n=1 Tax=Hyphococcus sp. TaxID=2038636 RepID=UPI003CCB79B0